MNFSIIIIACFCCAVNIIYIPFYVIHICHHKAKLKSVELQYMIFEKPNKDENEKKS